MCGIAGMVGFSRQTASLILPKMTDRMRHRGPDGEGHWIEEGIALGHRRLAIIDLSDDASQPMRAPRGRYTLIFNGEIYNFQEIKAQFPDYPFQSDSDTDVILAAYERWGADCLQHFNGMFALAIWDEAKQELFVARDRLGIKPLYWSVQDGKLLFASEVRSLLRSDLIPRQLNRAAIPEYLQYYSVNAPRTLIQGVQLLKAGHFAYFRGGEWEEHRYWALHENHTQTDHLSEEEVIQQTQALLRAAVERRMISDVPLGAFLSGGIDSSAIVALMASSTTQKVHTFSVTFQEAEYDESRYSSLIAKKYHTEHHPLPLNPNDFLEDLPEAMQAMDHPSGDGLNSYVVSKVTKEAGFTVALSGLGGDELFAGYPVFLRYQKLKKMKALYKVPALVRAGVSKGVSALYNNHRTARLQELMQIKDGSFEDLYPIFRKIFSQAEMDQLFHRTVEPFSPFKDMLSTEDLQQIDRLPLFSQVSVGEIQTYTQNVLLRDSDQMSMANSLEVRVPFFDHTLVEFALGVSDEFKQPHIPKQLLIKALGELLPDEVVYRKKMGFMFPWEQWMRGPLHQMCNQQLTHLGNKDVFQPSQLQHIWQAFQAEDKQQSWIKTWMLVALGNWMEANEIYA